MAGKSRYGDLTGRRFGRWMVRERAENIGLGRAWVCVCDCGIIRNVEQRHLVAGASASCGCLSNERHAALMAQRNKTHGLSKRPEYCIWKEMLRRCRDPKRPGYENYGGRGIKVCPEWEKSFEAFFSHIGPRPAPNLSLDRIHNDGNYEPGNVRWATRRTQRLNSRRIHPITIDGVTRTMTEWCKVNGISYEKAKNRIRVLGWPDWRAVSETRDCRARH